MKVEQIDVSLTRDPPCRPEDEVTTVDLYHHQVAGLCTTTERDRMEQTADGCKHRGSDDIYEKSCPFCPFETRPIQMLFTILSTRVLFMNLEKFTCTAVFPKQPG